MKKRSKRMKTVRAWAIVDKGFCQYVKYIRGDNECRSDMEQNMFTGSTERLARVEIREVRRAS